MLGMSFTELAIILILALLLLGPDQLPSVAKTLGKGMRELRKATDDLKSTFEQEMVKFEDEPGTPLVRPQPVEENRMLARDPGAARASARSAAAVPVAEDPGAARAAARMNAVVAASAASAPAPGAASAVSATPSADALAPETGAAPPAAPVRLPPPGSVPRKS